MMDNLNTYMNDNDVRIQMITKLNYLEDQLHEIDKVPPMSFVPTPFEYKFKFWGTNDELKTQLRISFKGVQEEQTWQAFLVCRENLKEELKDFAQPLNENAFLTENELNLIISKELQPWIVIILSCYIQEYQRKISFEVEDSKLKCLENVFKKFKIIVNIFKAIVKMDDKILEQPSISKYLQEISSDTSRPFRSIYQTMHELTKIIEPLRTDFSSFFAMIDSEPMERTTQESILAYLSLHETQKNGELSNVIREKICYLAHSVDMLIREVEVERKILTLLISALTKQLQPIQNFSKLTFFREEYLSAENYSTFINDYTVFLDSLVLAVRPFEALQIDGLRLLRGDEQEKYIEKVRKGKLNLFQTIVETIVASRVYGEHELKLRETILMDCVKLQLSLYKTKTSRKIIKSKILKGFFDFTFLENFYHKMHSSYPTSKWAFCCIYDHESGDIRNMNIVDSGEHIAPPFTMLVLQCHSDDDVFREIRGRKSYFPSYTSDNDDTILDSKKNQFIPVIFTNYELNVAEDAMSKQVSIEACNLLSTFISGKVDIKDGFYDEDFCPLIFRNLSEKDELDIHFLYLRLARAIMLFPRLNSKIGNYVGSVMVANGKVVSYEVNTIVDTCPNTSLEHAETLLFCKRFFLKKIPLCGVIYTSLKPCALCASVMHRSLSRKFVKIFYVHDDSGGNAKKTVADPYSKQLFPPEFDIHNEQEILSSADTGCISRARLMKYLHYQYGLDLQYLIQAVKSNDANYSKAYSTALQEIKRILLKEEIIKSPKGILEEMIQLMS